MREVAMGRWVAGAAAVVGVVLVVQMWPDISRYLRMRAM
jgi:hypothetical protein